MRKKIKNIVRYFYNPLPKTIKSTLQYVFYNIIRSESFVKKGNNWETTFSNGVRVLFKYPLYHDVKLIKQHSLKYSFKKGDVIIDGGAYHGYTSIFFSKLIGENGKVFSFEADSKTIEVLENSVKLNKLSNIKIIKNLLWSESTEIEFAEASEALSSIYYNPLNKNIVKKKAISLDEFVINNKLERLDFIKMNIEGAELEVIKGAKKTIEKFNPSFAISADHMVDGEMTYIKVENFFKGLNNYNFETVFYNDGNIITYASPE